MVVRSDAAPGSSHGERIAVGNTLTVSSPDSALNVFKPVPCCSDHGQQSYVHVSIHRFTSQAVL